MKSATIVSVDSGLGGLSVVAEIRSVVPGLRHVYVCDNAYFPYGVREDSDLRDHFLRLMRSVLERHRPDIIVAACNTISTLCLSDLRAIASVPVVGVVPAIKPAATMSRRRVIGLLATPATVERPYTDRLIDQFAQDCRVIRVGSAELVDIAEAKLRGQAPELSAIERIVAPFFDRVQSQQPDVVVLACTHFPLLKDELGAVGPKDVSWIDSGEAVARRVGQLLMERASGRHDDGPDIAILTAEHDLSLVHSLNRLGFSGIETLPVL